MVVFRDNPCETDMCNGEAATSHPLDSQLLSICNIVWLYMLHDIKALVSYHSFVFLH